MGNKQPPAQNTIYEIQANYLDGTTTTMGKFIDKVILIVNVASE